jgi:hypothetical protein
MAMVSCPNCKNEISSSWFTCPHCGYQLQTPKPIHFTEQSYLQRGVTAPRFVSLYVIVLSIVVFLAFPTPLKIYGFGVAIGLATIQVARGCYGAGTFSLIISVVLAAFGLGL